MYKVALLSSESTATQLQYFEVAERTTTKAQEAGLSDPLSIANPENQHLRQHRGSILVTPHDKAQEEDNSWWNDQTSVRFWLMIHVFIMPCAFLLTLRFTNKKKGVDLASWIGISIIIMYALYFLTLAYYFFAEIKYSLYCCGIRKASGKRHLFRVYTKTGPVSDRQQEKIWGKMKVAVHQQKYYYQAIQSISEFSAIHGGIASFMLANLGPFTWALVAMHFAAESQYNPVFHWDFGDYCEIIGVGGLVMIGLFELDPYNKSLKQFHSLGAAAGAFTIVGYWIQAGSISYAKDNYWYLAGPAVITIVALIFAGLWERSKGKTEETQKSIQEAFGKNENPNDEDLQKFKNQITNLSLCNVITEAVVLMCGATSMALYLFFYHEDCCMGCAGEKDGRRCCKSTWWIDLIVIVVIVMLLCIAGFFGDWILGKMKKICCKCCKKQE